MEIEHLKHLKYKAKYQEAKKEIESLKGGIQFNPELSNMFKHACQSVFVLNGKVLNNDCRAIILALIDEFNLCVKGRKPIHSICISQGITIDGDKSAHICLRYCPETECIEFNCCREIEKNVYRRDKIDRYLINLNPIDDTHTKMYVDDDYASEIIKKKSDLKADAISKFTNKALQETAISNFESVELAKETTNKVKELIKNVNEKVHETIDKNINENKLFIKKEDKNIDKNIVEEIKKIPEISGKDINIEAYGSVDNENKQTKNEIELKKPKGIITAKNMALSGLSFGLNKFEEGKQSLEKSIENPNIANLITGTEHIVKESIGTVSDVIKKSSNTVANAVTGMTNLINEFVQQGTEGIEKIAVGTTGAIASTAKGDVNKGFKEMEKVAEGTVTNAMNLIGDTTSSIIEIGKNTFENVENTGKDTVKKIETILIPKTFNKQVNQVGGFMCKFDV